MIDWWDHALTHTIIDCFLLELGHGGWVGGKALHACTDEVAAVGLRAALRIAPTVTMQMLALVTPGKQTKNSAAGRTRKV